MAENTTESTNPTIALDAMGGDNAPHEIIKGALEALKELPINIILVGKKDIIRAHLDKLGGNNSPNLTIHHAEEIVEMGESPSQSFKRKKDSSIRRAVDLVQEGKASAILSAGNTGAVMTASTLVLGRIDGVERPAIATLLPGIKGKVLMLDMGSNVDCKPSHLRQFAIMGSKFFGNFYDIEAPKVGLINIGEEEDKGNQLTQETFRLLKDAPINFIGNVEGKDILAGKADVLICDGFLGNNLLKFGEGVADFFLKRLKAECKKSVFTMLGALLMMPAIKRFKKKVDYEETGGAPLIGLKGISIIAHGSSNAKAIKNAIHTAYDEIENKMIESLTDVSKHFISETEVANVSSD